MRDSTRIKLGKTIVKIGREKHIDGPQDFYMGMDFCFIILLGLLEPFILDSEMGDDRVDTLEQVLDELLEEK